MWFKSRKAAVLGDFEQLVLLGVLRLSDGAYGAAIRQEIHARSGRDVSINAVYTTLDRLEDKGLVRSSVAELKEAGGQRRKVFVLTPDGERSINRAYATWQRATRGLKLKFEG